MIGRQVRTTHGGYIDLLALNQDGQLIVIELKRELTPREVVAQALDYLISTDLPLSVATPQASCQ